MTKTINKVSTIDDHKGLVKEVEDKGLDDFLLDKLEMIGRFSYWRLPNPQALVFLLW
jgi:hypothetical protein